MAVDWQKWLRRFALIFSVIVSFGASIGLGAFGVFYYKVVFGDDSYLKKSTIVARINEQTQIYFDDEKNSDRVFFRRFTSPICQHRRNSCAYDQRYRRSRR
jgi:hypothetical protein